MSSNLTRRATSRVHWDDDESALHTPRPLQAATANGAERLLDPIGSSSSIRVTAPNAVTYTPALPVFSNGSMYQNFGPLQPPPPPRFSGAGAPRMMPSPQHLPTFSENPDFALAKSQEAELDVATPTQAHPPRLRHAGPSLGSLPRNVRRWSQVPLDHPYSGGDRRDSLVSNTDSDTTIGNEDEDDGKAIGKEKSAAEKLEIATADGSDHLIHANDDQPFSPVGPGQPPPRPLRSALRRVPNDQPQPTAPVSRASTMTMEEGGIRGRRGIKNILQRLGLSRRQTSSSSQAAATTDGAEGSETLPTPHSNISTGGLRKRNTSGRLSTSPPDELMDVDDPRLTGAKPNRIDENRRAHEMFWKRTHSVVSSAEHKSTRRKRRNAVIKLHIVSVAHRQTFILKLARALLVFGAPSHRIESQLNAAARILELESQFVHIPGIIIASFGDPESNLSETHFLKASTELQLGKLHTTHNIYRQVVHDEIGAEEGVLLLSQLLLQGPIYGVWERCVIAFLCASLICPLAFGGSFVDMWVSGIGGAVLCYLQLKAASKSVMYANVFEISIAIMMSFVARALSSIPGNIFCYQAISSAGVVLILPGFLILCSSLELATKNIICGSVRMIYAIIYSLFLGFGLTIGSDMYFLLDSRARSVQELATRQLESVVVLHGFFVTANATILHPAVPSDDPAFPYQSFAGSFTFQNNSRLNSDVLGCHRNPNGAWFLSEFPNWMLFILVPMFSLTSSLWNLQPLKSKQLPVMIFISCCSFAANHVANMFIIDRSDVVSAIGAFVVGVLGNAYSRIFGGTAFTSMVTGVSFLVPSGIAAAGGLAMNYRGTGGDQYSNGLLIGLRMVQVGIGITVGLFASGLVVYSFGRKKQAALFAF